MDIFDLHCDTLTAMYNQNLPLTSQKLQVNLSQINQFQNFTQVFAVWIKEDCQNPLNYFNEVYNNGVKQLEQCGFSLVNKAKDLQGISRKKAIFSLEGGTVIQSEETVDYLFKLGIKTINLTWNYKNKIASGQLDNGGLTDFGRQIVRKMNKLNMAVDVSHLNDQSFFDVMEIAENVVASHSNCRTVFNHKRNLTDCQLKLLKQKNAIIGLNYYNAFLGFDCLKSLRQNVEHMLDMGLEKHIALGSDFDGADMSPTIDCPTKTANFHADLIRHRISKNTVDKIFFENAKSFFVKLLTKQDV